VPPHLKKNNEKKRVLGLGLTDRQDHRGKERERGKTGKIAGWGRASGPPATSSEKSNGGCSSTSNREEREHRRRGKGKEGAPKIHKGDLDQMVDEKKYPISFGTGREKRGTTKSSFGLSKRKKRDTKLSGGQKTEWVKHRRGHATGGRCIGDKENRERRPGPKTRGRFCPTSERRQRTKCSRWGLWGIWRMVEP